jgi:hypothetical protein
MYLASIVVVAVLAQTSTIGTNAQDRAKAQTLIGEGAVLYEHGDYVGALEKFNDAYAAYPSSKILFNLGQANRLLGRPLEALDAYQRFLNEVPNASREERADAQSWLEKLQSSLGQISIACQINGAEISVDGKVVGRSPLSSPVWATAGHHQVTAVAADKSPMLESVEVEVGKRAIVELLALYGSTHAEAVTGRLASAPVPDQTDHGWWLGRKWFWVAAGSTVLLAGTATVLGLSMQSRFDDLKASCGRGSQPQTGCSDGAIDSVHSRMVAANVFWGLTGAAAITAGALFGIEGRVAVAPIAGAANGLVAQMRF